MAQRKNECLTIIKELQLRFGDRAEESVIKAVSDFVVCWNDAWQDVYASPEQIPDGDLARLNRFDLTILYFVLFAHYGGGSEYIEAADLRLTIFSCLTIVFTMEKLELYCISMKSLATRLNVGNFEFSNRTLRMCLDLGNVLVPHICNYKNVLERKTFLLLNGIVPCYPH